MFVAAAAGSQDTPYVMLGLMACLFVGFVTYHISRRPPLDMAGGPAFIAGGTAGGLAIPITFDVLERLHLIS